MKKFFLVFTFVLIIIYGTSAVFSQTADHIVISEIQIGGTTSTDEFVELFNPTSSSVNVSDWRLSKKTASGSESNLLTTFPDVSISPFTFFLITHLDYDGTASANANYSTTNSVASNNTVILYSDTGVTVVDKVGMGTAIDYEGTATSSPSNNESIERKYSLLASEMQGPSQDTDDNSSDFSLQTSPNPQNSDTSLPVTLSSFTAIPIDSEVMLKWRTESEVDHLGWNVYRSAQKDGKFVKINDKLLPGAGNSAMPNTYQFLDKTAIKGRQYYYYLEDIDVSGLRNQSSIISISKYAKKLTTTWGRIKR
jgi:hypothetical protein